MPPSIAPASLPSDSSSEALLRTLLDISPLGILLLRPRYAAAAAADAAPIVDFTWEQLNPAAQRMLGLPECPTESFLTRYPTAQLDGPFAFYCAAFASGQVERRQQLYQAEGLDGYYHLVAQRQGPLLLVYFTDTNEQPRSAVEAALRESQDRERAARAETEAGRQLLHQVLHQLPLPVLLLQGPAHVVEVVNPQCQQLFPRRQLRGLPLAEGLPELAGQGFFEALDRVYHTGEPFQLPEAESWADFGDTGQLQRRYYHSWFLPFRDAQGRITGVLNPGVDVTEQVLARQQVEQLNQELEARVQARTRQLSEQQALLGSILGQVPAAVATFSGPAHRFSFFNAQYQQLLHDRAAYGVPVAEAIPEAQEQGFVALLDQVYQTGEPFVANEQRVDLRQPDGTVTGQYFNFVYQPLRDPDNHVSGILSFTVEVSEQVRSRQQSEALQAELLTAARHQVDERETFYQVFEQTPAAVSMLRGPHHRFEYVNPAYQQVFADRPLVGLDFAQALPDAEAQGYLALLDRVYQTGETYFGDAIPFVSEQPGQPPLTRYFNFTYQAYRENGAVVGISSFAFDVTEQVVARQQNETLQAELLAAARRQAAERGGFYHVLEQAPVGVTLLRGREFRFDYVNPTFQRIFPDRSLLGQTIATAFPEGESQGFIALHEQVYDTGIPYFGSEVPFVEAPVAGQPPRTTYFDFSYQALREGGETVGICAFAFDVTERVRARQEREARQGELQRLFEQAPVAIAVFRGPEYVIELANPSVCAIWGRTQAQAVGTPLFELLPEAAGQGFEELLDQVRATGEPFVAHELPSFIDRHGRRDTVYWNFVYAPLREADGRIERVTVVATEGTEQVLARQQVQALNQELTTANTDLHTSNTQLTRTNVDLDNFIYTASHDLKAPITNIEGLLLALEHELPAESRPGDVSLMLGMIQDAVDRFRRTIDHLTDLSRLQKEFSGRSDTVALAPVVEAVRLDLTPLLVQTQGTLRVDMPPDLTATFAEKNLRSVVYNLLSNAFKYHHPDRRPEVVLRSWPADGYTVLEVQDNGLGLDLTQGQERLFAMFQRLHTHVEGTGVGLYMVKKIVENAGGRIAVASELGQGTTFTVHLPQ